MSDGSGIVDGSAEFSFVELGLSIVVPPGVAPITRVSDLLGSAVLKEVAETDRVLDYGTGCGVNAILAARTSAHVVALDIVPVAVSAARSNAVRNRVADRLIALRSDGFSAVAQLFDVIILDATSTDLTRTATFFDGVGHHLSQAGRILIATELHDDLSVLLELISDHGFVREIAAQRAISRGLRRVPYVVFRLTRARPQVAPVLDSTDHEGSPPREP